MTKNIAAAAQRAGIDQLATDQLHNVLSLFEALEADDLKQAEEIAYSLTPDSLDAAIAFIQGVIGEGFPPAL